jgi:ferredoxin-fold anticodon binding domain-containing protein
VGFVGLGQYFSECFGFPCPFLFHELFHTHHHHPRAGTVGLTSGRRRTQWIQSHLTSRIDNKQTDCNVAVCLSYATDIICIHVQVDTVVSAFELIDVYTLERRTENGSLQNEILRFFIFVL